MGDAFIVSLMLQWLDVRVSNEKYFNRKTNTGYYSCVLHRSVRIFDLEYKTIKQGSFQILGLT